MAGSHRVRSYMKTALLIVGTIIGSIFLVLLIAWLTIF